VLIRLSVRGFGPSLKASQDVTNTKDPIDRQHNLLESFGIELFVNAFHGCMTDCKINSQEEGRISNTQRRTKLHSDILEPALVNNQSTAAT